MKKIFSHKTFLHCVAFSVLIFGFGFFFSGTCFANTAGNIWVASYWGKTFTKFAPDGSTTVYNAPGFSMPHSMVFDGTNIWASSSNNLIKIKPDGTMSTYYEPRDRGKLAFDGTNMWFAYSAYSLIHAVDKRTPDGQYTTYDGTTGTPEEIASDGTNMWTADGEGNAVTKITPTGEMTHYTVGTYPYGIAYDGTNMWTCNYDTVSKIAPDGTVTNYSYPAGVSGVDIAFDGTNMWVAATSSIVKVAPDGSMTNYPGAKFGTKQIAFDGVNMWLANTQDKYTVTKVTPDGSMTHYSVGEDPYGIVSDAFVLPSVTNIQSAPQITLSDAINIGQTAATVGGNLSSGVGNSNITIYWGTTDHPGTATGWDHNTELTRSNGDYSQILTGLSAETQYYFTASATNSVGTSWPAASKNFTTAAPPDMTNPTVSTLTPSDNATDIGTTANLVIKFSENVDVESGNITIKKSSDNSTVETIDVTSDKVTGIGTDTITINPATTLDGNTSYYVQIDATAFDDAAGNSYAGISNTTSWNFTTIAALPTVTLSLYELTTTRAIVLVDFNKNGGADPEVTNYWGTTDHAGSATGWDNDYSMGTVDGSFYYFIYDLTPGTTYYFTAKATNSNGTGWPESSLSFTPSLPNFSGRPFFTSENEILPKVGVQLRAGAGSLDPNTNLTYTWYRSVNNSYGKGDVLLASGTAYTPVSADIGYYILVVVTSTDAIGTSYTTTGNPVISAGSSASVNTTDGNASITAPDGFSSENVTLHITKIDNSSAPSGSGVFMAGDNYFSLTATNDSGDPVTTFSQPITFTISYGSDIESRFIESTLDVYKNDGGTWVKKNCILDTSANTLTCSLSSFSDYGVLGESWENSDDSGTEEKAQIDSWKVYRYYDENKSCSERLKLVINGKHFAKDTKVEIGDKSASSVDRKSSREIVAKFCYPKLLGNLTNHKRKIYVTNPDAETEEADHQIDLDNINYDNEEGNDIDTDYYNQKTQEGARHIQETLNKLGYLDAENITGTYGQITTEAVKKFQLENGIEPTGFVGPLTQAKLSAK